MARGICFITPLTRLFLVFVAIIAGPGKLVRVAGQYYVSPTTNCDENGACDGSGCDENGVCDGSGYVRSFSLCLCVVVRAENLLAQPRCWGRKEGRKQVLGKEGLQLYPLRFQ